MADLFTSLTDMPNIGNTLVDKLKTVGIKTPNDLINIGSENAFIRLITIDPDACINSLYALEGAVQGIRWHDLPDSDKLRLKSFFKSVSKSINNKP
jgi:DNA transformation protein